MPPGHEEGVKSVFIGFVGTLLGHEGTNFRVLVGPFSGEASKFGIDKGKKGKCILERV